MIKANDAYLMKKKAKKYHKKQHIGSSNNWQQVVTSKGKFSCCIALLRYKTCQENNTKLV
jgi:hypothetical protein